MNNHSTNLRPVVSFTLAYLIISSFFAISRNNWEFVFYIGVVLILALVVLTVHKRVGLTRGALWCLSLWGLLHMAGGLVPTPAGWPINGTKAVFYSLWIIPDLLKYDHVIHAFGFGVATWICWQAVQTQLHLQKPHFGVLVLCALGGMGLGAVNEVIEFVAVLTLPETNIGGYFNTGWDMVANTVGAVTAAVIIGNWTKLWEMTSKTKNGY